ncbi:MAG: tetratricopeptide repeat protein, partial [Acidobacteriota bacterium]|nr:tetratricopeptide repeat protein [Acidobacteriota bacterium]
MAQTANQRAIAAGNIGAVMHRAGRDAEAGEWLESSWQRWNDPATAVQLVTLYRLVGDYVRAEQVARAALAQSPADPQVKATLLNTVADILRELARDADSRPFFEEALHVPGAPWGSRLESLAGLADLDRDPARWQEAIQLAREHGDRQLEGIALRGVGETWITLGNPARAEPLLRQSLAVFQEGSEADGHQMASTLSALAELYIAEDKPALAEDGLRRALTIDE